MLVIQEAWFEVLLLRTVIAKTIKGGISGLTAALTELFFSEDSHNAATAGVWLKLHDGTEVHVFFELAMLLADEAALHEIYGCKGSSGLKPCCLCQNIFSERNVRGVVASDASGWAQSHTCTNPEKFVFHTSATIHAIVRRLRAAAADLPKGELEELETNLGWSYDPHAAMFVDRFWVRMNPPTVCCYDWMQTVFIGGVFCIHIGRMMWSLKAFGVTYEFLASYFLPWRWPAAMGASACSDVFSPKRAKGSWQAGSLKATASECLSICPILGKLAEALQGHAEATVQAHAQCLLKLVLIVEAAQTSARRPICPRELRNTLSAYMQEFQALFGAECMTPTFHMAMHFPALLERYGSLPSCFVHERKHRVSKRFANEIQNTSSAWESSVLRDVTHHHLAALSGQEKHFTTNAALINPHAPGKQFLAALQAGFEAPGFGFSTSRKARLNAWEQCSVGDVVVMRFAETTAVGRVDFHVCVEVSESEVLTLSSVQLWDIVTEDPRAWKCRRTDARHLCVTSDIVCAAIWSDTAGIATVIKPHRC